MERINYIIESVDIELIEFAYIEVMNDFRQPRVERGNSYFCTSGFDGYNLDDNFFYLNDLNEELFCVRNSNVRELIPVSNPSIEECPESAETGKRFWQMWKRTPHNIGYSP